MRKSGRFSLKKKTIILIVSIIVLISLAAGLLCAKGLSDISRNSYTSRSKELSATAAALVFILIGILLIDRAIIRPINTLSGVSEKYCQGESSAIRHDFSELQIHTGDEIETLSNSMKQMEKNINEHITRILETTQTLISTQHRADEMDRIANIDELTKVRNKRAYDLEIERVNKEIREGKTDVGLAMIDLNYLKTINDT